jgi:hydrogenase expression/formation protein HypD
MVYSTHDAVRIAEAEPACQVVFFAIGFETTTPPTAPAMRLAAQKGLSNFTIFRSHVLTPSAIQNIPESPDVRELGRVPIDGFIGPAHVSTVIGADPYAFFAEEFAKAEVAEFFELRKSFEWRGLGFVAQSGLRLKEKYAAAANATRPTSRSMLTAWRSLPACG